ncbi:unnamed protein product [Clonostachys rosea]|uniref:Transcription factor domain-containing protein n=1 Tax=Bionectria ochroleuca TaxID=29856 RepID=A0ABY6UDU1_BIOOC|nr:unnamed protein product [Clonostachys rosea]
MKFAFVSVDNRGKAKDTLQVRSHCMRGKNRREDSRRSRRALRQREAEIAAQTASNQLPTEELGLSSKNVWERQMIPYQPILDYKLLPDSLNHGSVELLYQYGRLKEAIYPIDNCVEFEIIQDDYIGWFATESAFVQSILFMGSALQDLAMQRSLTRTTLFHLRKTLSLLNDALSNRKEHLNDALLYTVFNLSLIATIIGEDEAFNIHLSGIRKLMQLRNQHTRQGINSRLGFKISRLELSAYTSTGTLPPLPIGPLCWESCYRNTTSCPDETLSIRAGIVDNIPLRTIFCDLRHLVDRINQKYASSKHLTGVEFQGSISSIQSRLLRLTIDPEDKESECVRLGMLAFLSTTLFVPGKRLASVYLSTQLKQLCGEITVWGTSSRFMVLWLLIVGSISVFAPDEPWILAKWAEAADVDLVWEELELHLRDILWIDCIHEEPARKAFAIITNIRSSNSNAVGRDFGGLDSADA